MACGIFNKIYIFLIISLFLGRFTFATEKCELKIVRDKNIVVQVSEDCTVEVNPYHMMDRSRSYTFYPDGLFLVFIDTQDYENVSKATGIRAFRLYPVQKLSRSPQILKNVDGNFEILTASSMYIKLNHEGEIESINGGSVKTYELKHIDKLSAQKGGFEIIKMNGIIVDFGWSVGGLPYSKLYERSSIRDSIGNECMVKNSEMFLPNLQDFNDPREKFVNANEWKNFIVNRCPNIHWINPS